VEGWDKRERVGGWGLGWRCLKTQGGRTGGDPPVSVPLLILGMPARAVPLDFFIFFVCGKALRWDCTQKKGGRAPEKELEV
jgi:hypothetical protein